MGVQVAPELPVEMRELAASTAERLRATFVEGRGGNALQYRTMLKRVVELSTAQLSPADLQLMGMEFRKYANQRI